MDLVEPSASISAAAADVAVLREVVGRSGMGEEFEVAVAVVGEDFEVLEGVVGSAPGLYVGLVRALGGLEGLERYHDVLAKFWNA